MTTQHSTGEPTMFPPGQRNGDSNGGASSGTTGMSAPALTDSALAALVEQTTNGPSTAPPMVGTSSGEAATATWRSNVTIDALWSIDETRNAFVHVVDLGWKKIFNGRDGAFQALVTLASQARQTNRPCNLREEADGMIYEIYLW